MNLPLEQMTVAEKLQAMEVLWEDICKRPGDMPSPDWHGELIARRAAAAARGDEVAESWKSANERIRRELS